MQNPMLGVLNQNRVLGTLGQIKQQVTSLQSLGNPQVALNQMLSSNPNMRQAVQYVQQHGGDPKKAMLELAQERGLDPQSILSALK